MAKTKKKKIKNEVQPLHVMQPNSAGIDIGSAEIYVAVPGDWTDNSVRRFDTFTDDLHKAAKWLKQCGIKSIAMESTGVYWIPVFQIMDAYGFDVILANARHVKNVPGRKTDVQDCQWLQYLHSVGLCGALFALLKTFVLFGPCSDTETTWSKPLPVMFSICRSR